MRRDGRKNGTSNDKERDESEHLLSGHRRRIDELDARILSLLNERMNQAVAIGRIKSQNDRAVLDPARETDLLRRLHGLNQGPMDDEQIDRIYSAIMAVSRDLQKRVGD